MSSRLAYQGILAALGLAFAPALFVGCREILGFEERELDTTAQDGGTDGPEPLSCEAYCAKITELCTGANKQYASEAACLGLCPTFPVGSLGDDSGHTLGCRIHLLEGASAMIETSECAAAGPSGNGVCGTKCDSYCTSMESVCPDTFNGFADCVETCTPLIDCGLYTLPEVTPDDPSIQCRIYHLSAAAENLPDAMGNEPTASQVKHCPHAAGETECIAVTDPMCP